MTIPIALTIAGSDSSGGAGIQADIKCMSALGVYSACAISALTAQNTREVRGIFPIAPSFLQEQVQAVYDDLSVDAVKIGMLATEELILTLARTLQTVKAKNIVLDPVMVAKSGDMLLQKTAIKTLKAHLMPVADVITPNVPEAFCLLGRGNIAPTQHMTTQDMKSIAKEVFQLGAKSVLLKGGHASQDVATDVFYDGTQFTIFDSAFIRTKNTHGTGCTLSSAIAANLAKGQNIKQAIQGAKTYITKAIQFSDRLAIGRGKGPVHHFHQFWTI